MLFKPTCGGLCDAANNGNGNVGFCAKPGKLSGVLPMTRLSNTSMVLRMRMSSETFKIGSRRKRMFAEMMVCVSSAVRLQGSPGKFSCPATQVLPSKGR